MSGHPPIFIQKLKPADLTSRSHKTLPWLQSLTRIYRSLHPLHSFDSPRHAEIHCNVFFVGPPGAALQARERMHTGDLEGLKHTHTETTHIFTISLVLMSCVCVFTMDTGAPVGASHFDGTKYSTGARARPVSAWHPRCEGGVIKLTESKPRPRSKGHRY